MITPQPPIGPPRQHDAAPDQDHPSRQQPADASQSSRSTANYNVSSGPSAQSAQGSATQQTVSSPSYAAYDSFPIVRRQLIKEWFAEERNVAARPRTSGGRSLPLRRSTLSDN